MSFLKKFLKKLLSFLKTLFEWLKKALVVALIVAALMFALSGAGLAMPGLLSVFAVSAPYVAAGLSLAGAFLIDKDYASEVTGGVIDSVGDVVGEAVGELGQAVGEGVSGVVSGIDSNIWLYGGLALVAYAYFSSDSTKVVTDGTTSG